MRCTSDGLVERLGGCFEGTVDRRLVVGEGDEPGLELGWRRVDAAVEQGAAEAGVGLEVAGGGGGEVGDRALAEEEGEQAGGGGDLERPVGGRLPEARGEAVG